MGLFFNNSSTQQEPTSGNSSASSPPTSPSINTEKDTQPQTVSSFLGVSTLDTSKLHPMAGISTDTLEYLSLEEGGRDRSTAFGFIPSRSYSDDILYGTGSVYLIGLGLGGLYGAREGLKSTKGSPFKVRWNGLLNGCTRRGPFLGNSVGIVALGYTSVNSIADYMGAPDNNVTAIGSGAVTGMLFKSTAGLRSSLIAGAICGSAVAVWKLANDAYNGRPVDYSLRTIET